VHTIPNRDVELLKSGGIMLAGETDAMGQLADNVPLTLAYASWYETEKTGFPDLSNPGSFITNRPRLHSRSLAINPKAGLTAKVTVPQKGEKSRV
jgi:hypothetical protein